MHTAHYLAPFGHNTQRARETDERRCNSFGILKSKLVPFECLYALVYEQAEHGFSDINTVFCCVRRERYIFITVNQIDSISVTVRRSKSRNVPDTPIKKKQVTHRRRHIPNRSGFVKGLLLLKMKRKRNLLPLPWVLFFMLNCFPNPQNRCFSFMSDASSSQATPSVYR